jgi:hypothetical protein
MHRRQTGLCRVWCVFFNEVRNAAPQASMSHISSACDAVCPTGITSQRVQRQEGAPARGGAASAAPRGGKTQRQERPAVAPPQLLQELLALECWSLSQANAAMRTNLPNHTDPELKT